RRSGERGLHRSRARRRRAATGAGRPPADRRWHIRPLPGRRRTDRAEAARGGPVDALLPETSEAARGGLAAGNAHALTRTSFEFLAETLHVDLSSTSASRILTSVRRSSNESLASGRDRPAVCLSICARSRDPAGVS